MSDFASTGNFRNLWSLAHRAVHALERIADGLSEGSSDDHRFPLERIATALDRSAPAPLETKEGILKLIRAVALAAKEHGGPMTEDEGVEFDQDYPPPDPVPPPRCPIRGCVKPRGHHGTCQFNPDPSRVGR